MFGSLIGQYSQSKMPPITIQDIKKSNDNITNIGSSILTEHVPIQMNSV